MSSNMSLNIAKMEDVEEVNSDESRSVQNTSLNQSMSILNCSLNADSNYLSNNVYSEHKSFILKYTYFLNINLYLLFFLFK